jgi:hypothetical protein
VLLYEETGVLVKYLWCFWCSKHFHFLRASLTSEAKEADEGSERKMFASAQDLQLPVTPLKSPVSIVRGIEMLLGIGGTAVSVFSL